jgi:multiple sugar transport system substrate-binding protein
VPLQQGFVLAVYCQVAPLKLPSGTLQGKTVNVAGAEHNDGTTLAGLSWGHRRASGALTTLTSRFKSINPQFDIIWHDRTLAGFESQKLADVAEIYDLVIYDHPFSGAIAAERSFLPLEQYVPELRASDRSSHVDERFVARNLDLYYYDDKQWGVPIDAATQHAIIREDLLAVFSEGTPHNWQDVMMLGARLRRRGLHLGCAFAKPHAGLVVASLMANQGKPWWSNHENRFRIDADVLAVALEQIAELAQFCPIEALDWDAIALHEAMVARDDIVYSPCVYGYATYGEDGQRVRLGWGAFPGPCAPFESGTTIGGAGLAISANSQHIDAAAAFVSFMMSDEAQDWIIPAHHGQPALRTSWDSLRWDTTYNGYFSKARQTLETAVVRPRIPGYIGFQDSAGQLVSRFLRGQATRSATVQAIMEASHAVESAAHG